MPDITRRTALTTGSIAVGGLAVVGLAACGGKSNGDGPGGDTVGGGGAAQPSGPVGLVRLSAVPVGGSVSAKFNGAPVIVSQQTAGTVVAFSAICTHEGCTVHSGGAQLRCPCHGSVYDAFTGEVLDGPAPKPLHPIAVSVVSGEVTTTAT